MKLQSLIPLMIATTVLSSDLQAHATPTTVPVDRTSRDIASLTAVEQQGNDLLYIGEYGYDSPCAGQR